MDIEQLFYIMVTTWQGFLLWLVLLFCLFVPLSKLTPCNPTQPIFHKGLVTDALYGLILPLFTRFIRIAFIVIGASAIFYGDSPETIRSYLENGFGPLGQLPLWLQASIVFIVSDFILYWTHRWFHGRSMWRFHAIHHSSEHVDWLSTFRFHPVNLWLSFTLVDTLMLLVGFSPEAVALMAGFNTIYSSMVHANLNWTFGPFKYIFASPVFHRWHHTSQEEGMDKNFAPTFPLLDIVFGTFYMPDNTLPARYGVPGSNIPKTFFGQILWPFRQ
jgi:sterol desaturase/sphingolipid hydroxylase (fatty acid hydroxylase superfamily)